MVGFHGNRIYQMKEKVICYIMIYCCYGFFTASNSYDFINLYCSNLLKNATVRGLSGHIIELKRLSQRLKPLRLFQGSTE